MSVSDAGSDLRWTPYIARARIGPALLVALLLATIAACAEEPPAPPPSQPGPPRGAATGDPCKLVTDAEAEAALRAEADRPTPEGDPVPNACDWLPETPGERYESVHVEIVFGGRPSYDANERNQGDNATEVAGIGEDAFQVDEPTGVLVTAVQGAKVVEVQTPRQADARELARKALARL